MTNRFFRSVPLTFCLAVAVTASQNVVVYSEPAGQKLTLDHYMGNGDAPRPIAILVHGGGFTGGSSRGFTESHLAGVLSQAGYEVFSVKYRLAPEATLGEATGDVRQAISFVHKNASRWHADPDRIALFGISSGGYFGALIGLEKNSGVQAVVGVYPMTDLRMLPRPPQMFAWLGVPPESGNLEWALAAKSPINKVRRGAPPFLLIHGDADTVVPFQQSKAFEKALQAKGVRCDLQVIPKAPHGVRYWQGLPEAKGWEQKMLDWLNVVLNRP